MTGLGADDPDVAADHLSAHLEDRPGSRAAQAWRRVANFAVGIFTGDGDSGPSMIDLVVRRLDGGTEVLRVSARSLQEAHLLLDHVRLDLETKTVAEFVAEWRLPNGV